MLRRALMKAPQDLSLIYRMMGRKGLESIENIGPMLAGVVQELLKGWISG